MKITAIVAEYNPFHLGHNYHLQSAREITGCDGVICIISGNFMQRGIPAIIDKWKRAELAVLNGADLVVELPLVYSISSAEGFGRGAIKILNSIGIVDNLFYGSEHHSNEELIKITDILLEPPANFTASLKESLSKGLPYHTAREIALSKITDSTILKSPNNILAIEYLKALKKYESEIKPVSLKRQGSGYNDSSLNKLSFSSATSIRLALQKNEDIDTIKDSVSQITYDYLLSLQKENYNFIFEESMFNYLKYKILTQGERLKYIDEVSEGLDNKIISEISKSKSLNDFILNVKSKRYTYTRISRILSRFFIGLENYDVKKIEKTSESYLRPLAFNNTGRHILKEIKEKNIIKIITNVNKNNDNSMLDLDILGTKAYSVLNNSVLPYQDLLKSPIYIGKE